MLDEALDTLEATVTQYVENGAVALVPLAAVTIRKLCHATATQTPLLAQLEQNGENTPPFLDASPGEMAGFSVTIALRWPDAIGAGISSPLEAEYVGQLPWNHWWPGNALCLPADQATGWQAGRLSVTQSNLLPSGLIDTVARTWIQVGRRNG